jgi:hypothetical protein
MRWIALLSLCVLTPLHARCPAPPPALAAQTCTATQHATVYASDPERAAQAAALVDAPAEPFLRHFGQALPAGVIYEPATAEAQADVDAALRGSGARWVLTLPPGGELAAEIGQQLRTALKDRSEAELAEALQQVQQQLGPAASAGALPRGLRYRVVHAALAARYWPDVAVKPDSYGTPAPDWLDEAVLTLFDPPETAVQRRALLAAAPDHDLALAPLQARQHPDQPMLGVDRGGGVRILRVDAADPAAMARAEALQDAALRQAQAASLAAYLVEQSPRAFGTLYVALARGEDFATWLRGQGAKHGLPEELAALERAWQAWQQARG